MDEHVPYPPTGTFAALKKSALAQTVHQLSQDLLPTFPLRATYRGTVKLHGTNATLLFRNNSLTTPLIQSRNRVLSATNDNYGTFAHLSGAPAAALAAAVLRVRGSTAFTELMIAGEVGGVGVQKGVAIAQMERFFCVFGIRVDGTWVDMGLYASVEMPERRVFNIMRFRTFTMTVDFGGSTKAAWGAMMQWTEEVGARCPFAECFVGLDGKRCVGAGEGIVWTLVPEEGHDPSVARELVVFKTKAEGFMTTVGARPMVAPDAGATERAERFVEYAVGKRRMEQGVEYVREMGKAVERESLGVFLGWVTRDTIKEESEVMREMGADEKRVRQILAGKARRFWLEKCMEA